MSVCRDAEIAGFVSGVEEMRRTLAKAEVGMCVSVCECAKVCE